MKRLFILGAGGHGLVCAHIAKAMNQFSKIVFLDDFKQGRLENFDILGTIQLEPYINNNDVFFVAFGDNSLREKYLIELKSLDLSITTLIDPSAMIQSSTMIEKGSVIMPGVILNAGSTIGMGTIINSGTIVEHDCKIGDFCHLSPGVTLGGGVTVGNHSWIGIGSTVIHQIQITSNVMIGAHSLVTKNLMHKGVYYGTPVRKMRDV